MNLELLEVIKNEYRSLRSEFPDNHIEFCKEQNNLEDAIFISAVAEDRLRKKHPHQWRIKKDILLHLANILVDNKEAISKCETFDDLYNLIEQLKPVGIGNLAIYDTALRLSHYLKIPVDRVYLHSGTRQGAIESFKFLDLTVKVKGVKYIEKATFPSAFQELSCGEIEDILCIYKSKFK